MNYINFRQSAPPYELSSWPMVHREISTGEIHWSSCRSSDSSELFGCVTTDMKLPAKLSSDVGPMNGTESFTKNGLRLPRYGNSANNSSPAEMSQVLQSHYSKLQSDEELSEKVFQQQQKFGCTSSSVAVVRNGLSVDVARYDLQQQQMHSAVVSSLSTFGSSQCNEGIQCRPPVINCPGAKLGLPAVCSLPVYGRSSSGPMRTRMSTHLHHTVAPYPNMPQQYMMKKRAQLNATQVISGHRDAVHYQQQPVLPNNGLCLSSVTATSPVSVTHQQPQQPTYQQQCQRLYQGNNTLSHQQQQQWQCLGPATAAGGGGVNHCQSSTKLLQPTFSLHSSTGQMKNSISASAVSSVTMSDGSASCSNNVRLSLPLRDGIILPTFKLEHNLSSSNYTFFLKDQIYQNLMARSDVELELRCFTRDESLIDWPATMTVSVNNEAMLLDRMTVTGCHRPVFLKAACRLGLNSLQINVNQCCCTHLIILQVVHYPSLRSVLRGLLSKRLMIAPQAIIKIKRHLMMMMQSHNVSLAVGTSASASANLSLLCPLSRRRITLPARGHDCQHLQCFDLESYLIFNSERNLWRCPICKSMAVLEYLEIDQYMWGIVRELATTSIDQVTIDITGGWKPVLPSSALRSELQIEQPTSSQRWSKALTISNLTLPSVQSWSAGHRSNSSTPVTTRDPTSPESIVVYSPLSCLSDPSLVQSPYQQPPHTPDCFTVPSTTNTRLTATTNSGLTGSQRSPSYCDSISVSSSLCAQSLRSSSVVSVSNQFAYSATATSHRSKCAGGWGSEVTNPVVSTANQVSTVGNVCDSGIVCSVSGMCDIDSSGCVSDAETAATMSHSLSSSVVASSNRLLSLETSKDVCFDSIFSDQQRKQVIDDILSETIPDLAEFLPATTDSVANLNTLSSSVLADDELFSLFT